MPSSRASTIPCVVDLIRQLEPKSILDVGVGFGKWGYLFREYTDIVWSGNDFHRYNKEGWKVRIEGIEAYREYLHEGHRFIYDKIHIGDATQVLGRLGRFDVIFFGDVIEHFPLDIDKKLLRTAIKQSDKCVIVTTPKYDTGQGVVCGNVFETHHSVWSAGDFRSVGNCEVTEMSQAMLVAIYERVKNV